MKLIVAIGVALLIVQIGSAAQQQSPKIGIKPDAESNGIRFDFGIYPDVAQLTGILGLGLPTSVGRYSDCSGEDFNCYKWGDYATLTVSLDEADLLGGCARVEWKSNFSRRLEDCFDIVPGTHWYGGGEMYRQVFPIESEPRLELAVVTADSIAQPGTMFGGITENYWLLSSGVSIYVDEDVPLFFSVNTTHPDQVCFIAKDDYPYKKRSELELKYTVCGGLNVVDVRQRYFQKFYSLPSGLPDEEMLVKPYFSTWAQYKEAVNQSLVLDYARSVLSNGFQWSSHIQIDDKWETCYGEMEFDLEKFPDPAAMVQELKSMNLRTTLWVHPFVNYECPSHAAGVNWLYFVSDLKLRAQNTYWWQGTNCGIIDVANPAAVLWWRNKLQKLVTNYGIDSFKFDAGETNWLPASSLLLGNLNLQPNLYSTRYVEAVSTFGGLVEVRAARRNQDKAIFFRMLDKDSRWGYENGLKSLIPTLLHFGILGYPFILPDMIGGNVYGNDALNKELFIRWMQANVFMPSCQFSVVPWSFDQETVDITKQVLSIREKYQTKILNAARQSVFDGSPINRPMFWADPNDPLTFAIDNQYMLGDDILVAPVLDEGAVARDIYLPRGFWIDGQNSAVNYTGPILLRSYPAPLSVIPYFIRQ